MVIFSLVCAYQVLLIAGKIGLAQLGRFATFVMLPAMFLFKLDYVHLVLLSVFVEITAGVATDVMFSRKMAFMANISRKKIKQYQIVGLIVSAAAVSLIFWLLTGHFQLGSSELFAQRSQARQLLINSGSFDFYVLIVGFVFGYILKKVKMSPMLVLGGILMPFSISLGLVAGGLGSLLCKNKDELVPLASGIFAANSLWFLGRALLKFVFV